MKCYFLVLGTILVVCVGCTGVGGHHLDNGEYVAPPASMLQRPGPMVDGPGPGVIPMMAQPANGMAMPAETSQIKFAGPAGMMVGWTSGAAFAENQLVAPGRYDFTQGATYQLKLSGIPQRETLTLYPSLEVRATHPTTQAYLAHNSIPVEITDDDLDQVQTNNFVTKVIYLPDSRHQELAIAGVETLVSTQLSPGADPVAEAERRGTVMVVLRMGNKDLEMPGEVTAGGEIRQASHVVFNGQEGQFAPPTPIATHMGGFGAGSIPNAMIMAGAGAPGQPAAPVAGVGPTPVWGMPITGTPIGLPGPPHLPLGGPAGLKSHTIRNLTETNLPSPVDHMLIDVRHEPGLSLPPPVKHIEYTEKQPVFKPGQVSYPASRRPW